jgi:hypothetical protein
MRSIKIQPVRADATNLERILAQIPQGKAICISYARQIGLTDERFLHLIRDYDADRKSDIGTLCTTHGIPHAEFLSTIVKESYAITEEALNFSHAISTGIVAARLPKVVERGMIEGAKADGIADRHFTLQKEGFHVAPKGVNISMTQMNANAAGLPNFEDETRALSDILSTTDGTLVEDHLLGAGDQDYVDAELETEDEEELAKIA